VGGKLDAPRLASSLHLSRHRPVSLGDRNREAVSERDRADDRFHDFDSDDAVFQEAVA